MKSIARIPLAFCAGVALAAAAPSAVCVPAIAQEVAAASPAATSSQGADYASVILAKVNELRASLGLAPVTRYAQLDAMAQQWSEHMSSTGVFAHRTDTSAYPAGWSEAKENIAMRYEAPGEDVGAELFKQWLNSPGHYANMTDPDVNAIGIGLARNTSSGGWYGTQNFAAYADPAGAGLTPTGAATIPALQEPAPVDPAPAPREAPKPAPEPTAEQTTPAPAETLAALEPSDAASAEPTEQPSVVPSSASAAPTTASTPKATAGAGTTKAEPVPTKAERQVIALPTPGDAARATDPATPGVAVVAAPERPKPTSAAGALPMTGVSLGSGLVALGLTGAGVIAFTVRARRRA